MKRTLKISLFILTCLIIQACEDKPTPPVVSTTAMSSISYTSATSGGNLTNEGGASIISRGVCWSTTPNPTVFNNNTIEIGGLGSFVSNITPLVPNTGYYVRAYATNSAGTGYGNEISFSTLQVASATLTTNIISLITTTTAASGGNITSDNGGAVTSRGVCWSTTRNPTIDNSKTLDGAGTGNFTSSLTGLTPGTLYYVRAYSTNSAGTSYGNERSFTSTAALPTVTTTPASLVTGTTARSGGNITSDGGALITARGICWSTNQNPTTSNSKTNDGTGTGVYISSMTGLSSNTYYVRAYATNSQGTAYGNQISFTTATSKISGIVRDASTSVPIANVTVTVYMTSTSIGNTLSLSDGRYEINVPANNGYRVVFSKIGYLNAEYQNVNVAGSGSTILEPVLQIDQAHSGIGSISGTIKNAIDGLIIPGVSLKLRSGINVTSGTIIATTTTTVSGTYTFNNVSAGNYTIEASILNYSTTYFTVICLGGLTVSDQTATMSPVLITGETRIVLTWGASPSDLDSHFTGPLADGTRFHMYYPYAELNDGSPWPDRILLDLDDVSSYGPETTTLLQQIAGVYRFTVHDYTNKGLTSSTSLSNSGAQVRVYQNSGLIATFNVPPNTGGTLWTVFEMSNSTISTINQMSYEADSQDVTKGMYINPENKLFNNLLLK